MYSPLTGNSCGQGANPFPRSMAGLPPPVTVPQAQAEGHLHTRPAGRRETAAPGSRSGGSSSSSAKQRWGCQVLGGTGPFGQGYWQCFWSTSLPLVWHTAKGSLQQLAITSLQQSEMLLSSNAVVLLLSLINESDRATVQYIDFQFFFLISQDQDLTHSISSKALTHSVSWTSVLH